MTIEFGTGTLRRRLIKMTVFSGVRIKRPEVVRTLPLSFLADIIY